MTEHTLLRQFKKGQKGINGWLFNASGMSAEIMAQQGYHSITTDLQHGLNDYSDMVASLQTLAAYPVTPMVRVAANDHSQITHALDAGAMGIICPMINNADEAKHFVSSLYYPPVGSRSYGPIRAGKMQSNYFSEANESIIGFAMIETKEAMLNLEEIVNVSGISGVYIGPSDLAISYGHMPGYDRKEPELIAHINSILSAAKKAGILAAIHTNNSTYAIEMLELGFDMVTLMNDVSALQIGLKQTLAPLKKKGLLLP